MADFPAYPQGPNLSPAESNLKSQLQWYLLLRVILYTLLLTVSFFFHDAKFEVIVLPLDYLLLFISFIYIVTIGSAAFLNYFIGNLRKFGFIQCLLDTIFVSILIFYTGSSHSIFISVYFFPIFSGGLILPKKGGFVAAAAATLQFGTILILELLDIFPSMLRSYDFMLVHDNIAIINHFAVRGVTFFLAASITILFSKRLHKAEKELTATQQNFVQLNALYKLIFDNISTGIITLDEQNRITSVNNSAEVIIGYSIDDIQNKELDTLFPTIKLESKTQRQATEIEKKQGQKTRVGYSFAEFYPEEEHSYLKPHKVLTIQDISEIEDLEQKFRQSEKLAAIGMMSASIAHDFRNPLTAISGSAQILSNDYVQRRNDSEQANFELTDIIIRESRRLMETITNFLRFAKPEVADKEWFSLKNCIEEVLQVFKASNAIPATCFITIDIDPSTDVWADNRQVFHALSELLLNAIPFCPEGKERIIISTKEITLPADETSYIKISISDNGKGVPVEDHEKILEPFYTSRVDGTGLGLSIIKQTMDTHKGFLEFEGSDLGGAKFSLFFPLP